MAHYLEVPTYEQWRESIVTGPVVDAQRMMWGTYYPEIVIEYLIALFTDPTALADVPVERRATVVWALAMQTNELLADDRDTAQDRRVACIESIESLFRSVLEPLCNETPTSRDEPEYDFHMAVHMFWDSLSLQHQPEQSRAPLIGPAVTTLSRILDACKNEPCRYSAMHGLGHLYEFEPQRVRTTIDRFLQQTNVDEDFREYIFQCREGNVL